MRLRQVLLIIPLMCSMFLAKAQPASSFTFPGGNYKLTAVCEWLNKTQALQIGFSNDIKAMQQVVNIRKDTYTFESLFQEYFQPHNLQFSKVGQQIIIHSASKKSPGFPINSGKGKVVTMSGYIIDSTSGERLQGATVVIAEKGWGAISNNYGFYSATLPPGRHNIVISFTGYQPIVQELELNKDTVIAFPLAPAAGMLSTVTVSVTGNKNIPIQQNTQISMIDMPIKTIESMPKLLGETDVFRSLQFLPGVQAGNEASSGLYIRGGSPDQNLILLDGVPVYNASHLFGIFSVFNSDALQSVQLYKGGFPARYGGRLSSVVDLRMKEGNKHAWHGEGGIGLLASRLTLEGPLKKGRSSIMMSGRVTNWGPLIKLVSQKTSSPDVKTKAFYNFYDLNLKTNFYLSPKDHLYVSGYFGKDKLQNQEKVNSYFNSDKTESLYEIGLKWGNATAVARWNHQFSKKMFSNTTMHYSRYNYKLYSDNSGTAPDNAEFSRYYQKNNSNLQDVAVKFDLDIIPNPAHYIRTGVSATRHYFVPGNFHSITENRGQIKDTTITDGTTVSTEYDVYIEDDVLLTKKWKANIGLHGTGFTVGKTFYTSLQPRLNARYLINDEMSVKGSFVYMSQFIHLLSNSGIGMPTDLWVPVTEKIPPQKSLQYTIGAAYTSAKKIEFSIEGYYKKMENVLDYEEGAAFTNTTVDWEKRVAVGNSKSRGIELLAQKKAGRTTGLLSYTLSKTDRIFTTINKGQPFPYRYDRRHDLKWAINHQFSAKKELSFDWVLGSGQAITVPLQVYANPDGKLVTVYSDRNSFRLPLYHRADVSMSFHKQKRKYHRTWIVGLYNLYGRQNPMFVYADPHSSTGGLMQTSILALPIPSITYQFKF